MLCRSHNGNVISIRSLDEDVFVQKVALEMPSITKIWIGLEMLWGHRNWLDLTVEKPAQTAILNVNRPEGKVSAFEDYPDKPNTAKCIRCKQTKMNGLWYFVGLNESLNETYRPDGVVCKKRIRRPPIKYTIKSNESCDIGWAHNEHTGFCYYLQVKPRLKVPESDAGCGAYHNVWIGIHQVNGTAVNVDGSVNRFWVPPFEPGKSNQWWMMCNDISNTYVESILPHNEHGVLTRYVCKKVANNL
ncbi:unnamed protein product, partial [Mesorhabditis belari]|uniref:C-type lectin domain-containing protein n=1 Tax=Mesorhabditis belari TaxID=2138241 RepID=A0AAF3EL04_9BILA